MAIYNTLMEALIMNPLKVFCTIKSWISRCICRTHIIRSTALWKKPQDDSLKCARIPNTQDADTGLDWIMHRTK